MVGLLKDVLNYVGVDPSTVQLRALIRRDWEPARITLEIPASPATGVSRFHSEVEAPTVDTGIQEIARGALKYFLSREDPALAASRFRHLPRLPGAPPSLSSLECDASLWTTAYYAALVDSRLSALWSEMTRQKEDYQSLWDSSQRQQDEIDLLARALEALHSEHQTFQSLAATAMAHEQYQRTTVETRLALAESRTRYLDRARAEADSSVREEMNRHTELVAENRKLRQKLAFYERNNRANTANMIDLIKKVVYLRERNMRLREAWREVEALRARAVAASSGYHRRIRERSLEIAESELELGASYRVSQPLPRYTQELDYAIKATDLLSANVGVIRRRLIAIPPGATLESCPDFDASDYPEVEEPR